MLDVQETPQKLVFNGLITHRSTLSTYIGAMHPVTVAAFVVTKYRVLKYMIIKAQ